jgi:ribosomal protein L11 methyltransferase
LSWRVRVGVPQQIRVDSRSLDRDAFYAWLWERFPDGSLLGVHEGSLLSEQAAEQGLETESWMVDAGEAPRERDWMAGQKRLATELYFSTEAAARSAWAVLSQLGGLDLERIEEQPEQDWDAEWKASFQGVEVPPCWDVVPPWVESAKPGRLKLLVNPGAGFGTGTHETTQLCLGFIADCAGSAGPGYQGLVGRRVLDFGSGSGILAIGAALLGAQVSAVEIDPLAIENATENARLNDVDSRIEFSRELGPSRGRFDVIIANILRPVLIEFAPELVARLAPRGAVILSGLIETDVPEVSRRYSELLGGLKPEIRALNEWRGLCWRR